MVRPGSGPNSWPATYRVHWSSLKLSIYNKSIITYKTLQEFCLVILCNIAFGLPANATRNNVCNCQDMRREDLNGGIVSTRVYCCISVLSGHGSRKNKTLVWIVPRWSGRMERVSHVTYKRFHPDLLPGIRTTCRFWVGPGYGSYPLEMYYGSPTGPGYGSGRNLLSWGDLLLIVASRVLLLFFCCSFVVLLSLLQCRGKSLTSSSSVNHDQCTSTSIRASPDQHYRGRAMEASERAPTCRLRVIIRTPISQGAICKYNVHICSYNEYLNNFMGTSKLLTNVQGQSCHHVIMSSSSKSQEQFACGSSI